MSETEKNHRIQIIVAVIGAIAVIIAAIAAPVVSNMLNSNSSMPPTEKGKPEESKKGKRLTEPRRKEAATQETSTIGFNGVWEGAGMQDNNSSWTIKATIRGNHYVIEYPSLNCGGKLVFSSGSSEKIEFIEQLIYGKSACIDNGKIIITKVGDSSAKYE